jgi:hypothetical protein
VAVIAKPVKLHSEEVVLGMNLNFEVGKKRRLAKDALGERVAITTSTSTSSQNDPGQISPRFWFGPSSISGHREASHPVRWLGQPDRIFKQGGPDQGDGKALPFKLRSPKAIPLPIVNRDPHTPESGTHWGRQALELAFNFGGQVEGG